MRILLLIGVLCSFFLLGCQDSRQREKEKDVPTGYTGKARLNPYLAAEIYLKNKGWDASSSRTWSNYGSETSVIFMPASYLQTKGMGIRALDWVTEGGTLILTVDGGAPERNDFTTSSAGNGVPEVGQFAGMDYLFEELEIEITNTDWSDYFDGELAEDGHLSRAWHLTKLDDEELHLEMEGDVGLSSEYALSWDFQVEGVSRMIGVGYGDGDVMVLAHARPLRSAYLARADHGKFLEVIADYYADGDLVFLYGSGTSFFELLWKEGHMVVIAGIVLLAFWLWMRIPRFGPVLQDAEVQPKPYGEELKASARFLWRRGQIDHYLRPLRKRLELENEGDPETLCERLAETSQSSTDEVAEVLATHFPKDPGHIFKVVQKLQSLLKR